MVLQTYGLVLVLLCSARAWAGDVAPDEATDVTSLATLTWRQELEQKASYEDPWKRGQRGIIPAASFMEPNWKTGRNQWWQFRRADGTPWGLAGLSASGTPGPTR